MSPKPDDGTRRFALPNIAGRGFAMGHQSGLVSLCLVMGNCSFSMDPVSNAEARALAKAVIDAADFAAEEQMRRVAKRETAVPESGS